MRETFSSGQLRKRTVYRTVAEDARGTEAVLRLFHSRNPPTASASMQP